MRLIIPAIILAIAIILAPVLWYVLPMAFGQSRGGMGPAIDSQARIEIEILNQQVEDIRLRMEDIREGMAALGQEVRRRPAFQPQVPGASLSGQAPQTDGSEVFRQNGTNDIIDAYAQVVLIADRRNVNKGLKIAGGRYLTEKLGLPRQNLSDKCEAMTNPRLKSKLKTTQVGPIRVTMLQPALDSLARVFENVRITDPDLYARINTAGALCVRRIRGTTNRVSTHSFGLAVDLNIDGKLDTLGDGRTQLGLTILADFFRTEGWVWGASWGREDSMHFEISRSQLDKWLAEGAL
ncbi:Peptidase M15 4 domain containing protein [Sulfitobacter noctilucae]|uniref:M15 family metallopeptidase n=1 Tax=Sulfitobacter noctilucae TaxID=1342302 RepID=UPI0004684EC9|nr:M15 family metallopeptidase [Sulfitobacter noctilucae]KIN70336.1 Peptidase M15 4 domain containing protein [Sulfitobacter noctilucae]